MDADDPHQAHPPRDVDPARRKLLLALGFGVASAGGLRHLSTGGRRELVDTSGGASTPAPTSTVAAEVQSAALGVGEANPTVQEVPVLDASLAVDDPNHVFDIVFQNGRVMDPETGFDAIATVGIDAGVITHIGYAPRQGRQTVNADGRVVSPGFIDILSYSPNDYGEWYKIADGVTANIGMHGLDGYAETWFERTNATGAPVHYGGAYDNAFVRPANGVEPFDEPDANTIEQIVGLAETDLLNGFIGLHMQPEYTPGATPEEVLAHGRLAARYDVPLCLHARYSDNFEPGVQADAMAEVVNVARETGAWVHVEHINSTGGTGRMADALATLEAGRDEGLRISACIYPYTFWATYLRSARYDDWQNKYGITYSDLQIAGTSERLTEATYQQALEDNRLTAAYAIPEDDVVLAMQADWVMLGSDAILEPPHNNHPRSTGCFARALGTYVRDRQVISLMSGLAKATILPAQLLGTAAPAMQRKGRMQIGADADITVFDPLTITDRSTIENPAQESTGVDYVLVDGTIVKTPAGIDRSKRPGTAITSALR